MTQTTQDTQTLYARLALPKTKKGRAKYAGSVYIENVEREDSIALTQEQCASIAKLAASSDGFYRRNKRSPYRSKALAAGSLRVGLTSHNGPEIAEAAGVFVPA